MQGDTGSYLVMHIAVTNNSSSDIDVKVRKRYISVVPGSEPTFCWDTNCWQVGSFESIDAQTLTANSTDSTSFTADYDSKGHSGTSTVVYTFFNVNDIIDTVCFIATFTCNPSSGIAANENSLSVSPAYPNPANKATYISYSLPLTNRAKIIVTDMIGNEVKIIPINDNNDGKVRIDTYDFTEGIYFYSFIIDNKIYYTKKLVVAHQ